MAKITQNALQKFLVAKAKAENAELQLKLAEEKLRKQLETGATVQPGLLSAYIKTWSRRSVAWKDVVVRVAGEEYADRVLGATKPEEFSKVVVGLA